MNLLRTIIERLNQRIEVANIFDKQFNLCELNANGNDKAWVHYIGNGQAEVVTNFDAKNGTLFWAKRSKVTVNKTDAYKVSGCKQLYITSFPLTAYAIVKKSHLPCDSEDAQDWLASRIYKLSSGTDPLFKQSIGVINYEVVPTGYINEIKTLTANYEWACVSVDMDVQVITSSEDGCYDTCATGDIPLPDLQPCTPCLTEVAVDGITIIGNGTAADPLVAIGGGGGGGALIAIAFSTDHLTSTGNQYVVGNVVWYLGNVYRCIAANDSILPTNAAYWVNLGAGLQTIERPIDWDATSGNNQILNKPNIPVLPATIVEDVTGTAPIFSSGGTTPDITITQADASTDGYLSSADWTTFDGKQDVLSAGSDISIVANVVNNTAPDQVVVLTAGTDIAVSGTYPNFTIDNTAPSSGGTVTSVDLTMPSAFNVSGNPITTSGTLAVTGAGAISQYIRGDGSLATLPTALPPSGAAGGDLSGTYPNPTVSRIHGVDMQSGTPTADDLWIYGGAPAKWQHGKIKTVNSVSLIGTGNITTGTVTSVAATAGAGIAITGSPITASGTLTITNSAPDQVVALTAGSGIGVTGTYPNFTINNTAPSSGGTVTAVSGTSPIVSSGGSTPAISIADADADGATKGAAAFTAADFNAAAGVISIDYTNGQAASASAKGFLTSANWTTFNNKTGSIYKDLNNQAAVVATTANTKVVSQLVPANTFAVGDIIEIKSRFGKTISTGLTTFRFYINTADSLTVPAATLIATSATTSGPNNYLGTERQVLIKSATVTQSINAPSSLFSDLGNFNGVQTNSNIDWTVNQYIIFAIQNAVITDSTVISYFQIIKQ